MSVSLFRHAGGFPPFQGCVFGFFFVLAASRLYVVTLFVLTPLRVFYSGPSAPVAMHDARGDGESQRKALPWQMHGGQGLIGRGGGP